MVVNCVPMSVVQPKAILLTDLPKALFSENSEYPRAKNACHNIVSELQKLDDSLIILPNQSEAESSAPCPPD